MATQFLCYWKPEHGETKCKSKGQPIVDENLVVGLF